MKISIDLDGTLFAYPEFFRELMVSFKLVGHEVGILTGHKADSEEKDREKLAAMGFYPDFYLGRAPEYMPLNGSIFKRDMIAKHNIDIHFDDCDYDNPESIRLFYDEEHVRLRLFRLPKDNVKAKEHG